MMAKSREPDNDNDAAITRQPAQADESPFQMRERLEVLKEYASSLRAFLERLRHRLH
jgi:hypothetical protein